MIHILVNKEYRSEKKILEADMNPWINFCNVHYLDKRFYSFVSKIFSKDKNDLVFVSLSRR